MSYDELMDHAYEIRRRAVEEALEDQNIDLAEPYRSDPRVGGEGFAHLDQVVEGIEAEFADIPDLFRPFNDIPDPEAYSLLIEEMENANRRLSTGRIPDSLAGEAGTANTDLELINGNYLEGWMGAAAMTFRENYLLRFPSLAGNRFLLSVTLRMALEAHQAMWTAVRHDIDGIAHGALAALDDMDSCGRNEWGVALTVAAAIVPVIAAPVTFGASTAVGATTFTAIGSALSTAAAANGGGGEPDRREYGGETARVVINNVREAISQLRVWIMVKEEEISSALRGNLNVVTANREDFVVPRPALADATADNITSQQFMGYAT